MKGGKQCSTFIFVTPNGGGKDQIFLRSFIDTCYLPLLTSLNGTIINSQGEWYDENEIEHENVIQIL